MPEQLPVQRALHAEVPWLGPVLMRNPAPKAPSDSPPERSPDPPQQPDPSEVLTISLGANPTLGQPKHLCFAAIERSTQDPPHRWQLVAGTAGISSYEIHPDANAGWLTLRLPHWIAKYRYVLVVLIYPRFEAPNGGEDEEGADAPYDPDSIDATVSEVVAKLVDKLSSDSLPLGVIELPDHEGEGPLRLALGACQYPRGMLDQIPSLASWRRLNSLLQNRDADRKPVEAPDFLLLTGDQIYADATAGLFDPTQLDDRYRNAYETWLHADAVRLGMSRLITAALPDDHEIDDNWEPDEGNGGERSGSERGGGPSRNRKRDYWKGGVRDFLYYFRPPACDPAADPALGPAPLRLRRDEIASNPLSMELKLKGIPVFMLDTRTRRGQRMVGAKVEPGLLDPVLPDWSGSAAQAPGAPQATQAEEFRKWLATTDEDAPKLVVCPSAILPRHRDATPSAFPDVPGGERAQRFHVLRSDGWDGYPDSLAWMFDQIVAGGHRRVIFLSGDEHIGIFTKATLTPVSGSTRDDAAAVTIHSIHAPGLYTPYPFANALQPDLVLEDRFELPIHRTSAPKPITHYECVASSTLVEGAGFVLITLANDSKGWTLDVKFDRETGSHPPAGPERIFSLEI